MAESIRVDTSQLDRALDKLGDDLAHSSTTHAAVVRGILPGVMLRTPVRTGRLAGSWRTTGEDDRGVISSDETYAGPIESGVPSRGIRAYRMVQGAIDAETSTIVKQYEDGIRNDARRVGFDVK